MAVGADIPINVVDLEDSFFHRLSELTVDIRAADTGLAAHAYIRTRQARVYTQLPA